MANGEARASPFVLSHMAPATAFGKDRTEEEEGGVYAKDEEEAGGALEEEGCKSEEYGALELEAMLLNSSRAALDNASSASCPWSSQPANAIVKIRPQAR